MYYNVLVESVINNSKKSFSINRDLFIKILKVISIIFAFIVFWRVLGKDYFGKNLFTMNQVASSDAARIIIASIRLLNNGLALAVIVSPFFEIKALKRIVRYFGPVLLVVNLMFSSDLIFALLGPGVIDGPSTYFMGIQFFVELGFLAIIIILNWFVHLKYDREKLNGKERLKSLYFIVVFALLCIVNAPLSTLLAYFGPSQLWANNFQEAHRFLIYFTLLVPFYMMFRLRNKTYDVRYCTCLVMSIATFFTFFSTFEFVDYTKATALPLHLCNTAVIIMLIAMVFRNRPCFYFNYLINILGSVVAIMMPETKGDLFYVENMHFWHNHILIVVIPLLAMGLKLFSRPTWKMVLYSIIIFSIYFVGVAAIDAYFGEDVNYFFLNTDKIADTLTFLLPIRNNYQWVINAFDREMVVYTLYWLIIYVGYCGLAVGTWFVFSFFYKISDHHYDIYVKIKKIRLIEKEKKELRRLIKLGLLKEEGEEKMIEIEHFTKIYGKEKKKAVNDFSLTINSGEIFGFLGHNGAGKSTLIKCLIGVQPITEGSIKIFGHDISKDPLQTKLLIGYVPDNHAVYEGLTGREYVNYIADLFLVSTEDRIARLDKYAKLFEIETALDKPIKSYSHGMKQKITIIAALIHEPKVWVLDEPLTGLDPTSCYQIKECMKEHARKGNIVFFSSHVIDVVENVCTNIGVISHGKLKCTYSLDELKKENIKLEDIYLKYVQNANRD